MGALYTFGGRSLKNFTRISNTITRDTQTINQNFINHLLPVLTMLLKDALSLPSRNLDGLDSKTEFIVCWNH